MENTVKVFEIETGQQIERPATGLHIIRFTDQTWTNPITGEEQTREEVLFGEMELAALNAGQTADLRIIALDGPVSKAVMRPGRDGNAEFIFIDEHGIERVTGGVFRSGQLLRLRLPALDINRGAYDRYGMKIEWRMSFEAMLLAGQTFPMPEDTPDGLFSGLFEIGRAKRDGRRQWVDGQLWWAVHNSFWGKPVIAGVHFCKALAEMVQGKPITLLVGEDGPDGEELTGMAAAKAAAYWKLAASKDVRGITFGA